MVWFYVNNGKLPVDGGDTVMISLFAEDGTRKTKVRMGTAGYMAPEVVRGEPATEKSDIYSLGVIFFRMLTGIWYEPGSAALELLDMYDYHWDKVLPWMLDADPTARPPWLDRKKMLGGQIGKRPKP